MPGPTPKHTHISSYSPSHIIWIIDTGFPSRIHSISRWNRSSYLLDCAPVRIYHPAMLSASLHTGKSSNMHDFHKFHWSASIGGKRNPSILDPRPAVRVWMMGWVLSVDWIIDELTLQYHHCYYFSICHVARRNIVCYQLPLSGQFDPWFDWALSDKETSSLQLFFSFLCGSRG